MSKVSEEKNGNILLNILIERKGCDDESGQSRIRMYRKLKKKKKTLIEEGLQKQWVN